MCVAVGKTGPLRQAGGEKSKERKSVKSFKLITMVNQTKLRVLNPENKKIQCHPFIIKTCKNGGKRRE